MKRRILQTKNANPIVAAAASVALMFSLTVAPTAFAEEKTRQESPTSEQANLCGNLVEGVSVEEEELLMKVVSVADHFHFSGDKLTIDLTEDELKNEFGFTSTQYAFLQKDVLDVANGVAPTTNSVVPRSVGPQVDCSGWYISNLDLTTGTAAALVSAASAGPEALAAALTAMASVVGGPIGTIIGGGIAVLGTAFFIDLGAKILGAVAQGKGICLGLTWAFPPIVSTIM